MVKLALISLVAAFVLGVVIGPFAIKILHKLKFGQQEREDGVQSHLKKAGTPTMGGLIFLIPFALMSFIFGDGSFTTALFVVTVLMFGLIGFADDMIIIAMKRSLGLTAKQKLILQFLFSFLFVYICVNVLGRGTELILPGGATWDIGIFYYILMTIFMAFMVNAVNLTDGVDGLAGGVSFLVLLGYMLLAMLGVNHPPIESVNYTDLSIGVGALAGGVLAFLVFNRYPAKVFMGDTGSLALGGAVMAVAILTKTEVILLVIGLIYIVEALSVMLQVASFKLTGKRIFKMAPLHHHFELSGWSERKIVAVFQTICAMCVLIGLILTTVRF